jgi:23S rRNA (adenine-N6)-dimethyltransferase
VVLGDFLLLPLPEHGAYKVAGNVPFAITSSLIRKLLQAPNPPSDSVLVVQREAALRWSGDVRETAESVAAKVRFEFDIRLALRRRDFHPHPRVESVVLGMRRRPRPLLSPADERVFRAFVEHGFGRGQRLRDGGSPGEIAFDEWLAMFRERHGAGGRPGRPAKGKHSRRRSPAER